MNPFYSFAAAGAAFAFSAHATVPTVPVAPGVNLPLMVMGGVNATTAPNSTWSNYSLWLEIGNRGFDTAWSYQTSRAIGAAIRSSKVPRSEIFIETKIPGSFHYPCTSEKCNAYPEPPPVFGHYTADQARGFISYNLEHLGTYIDLLLLHDPCNQYDDTHSDAAADECAGVYKVMEEALQNGTVKAIGVSNHDSVHLQQLMQRTRVKPVVNQNRMTLGSFDVKTLSFCQQHGITYEAWSPLESSHLHDDVVSAAAAAHGVSVYQIALRYLTQKSAAVVIATDKLDHMIEDASVFSFQLTDAEMSAFDALNMPDAVIV